ncbi:BLOC-1-related complex subunit 5 [Leptidea sinapis]|uniref:BLOC-1-related complex subunit 5 n=1 Tax=Leptidea sinapis TaxID=189913 RepID=UPI0021359DA8|nr:BLOC-1-related complex subunit 5 [Leptidea sinapis]
MGSEQSVQPRRQTQRAPPVRRGHTIAGTNFAESRRNETRSGNNSPGASMCSDSELPYISYTVDRPIGDSPKHKARSNRPVLQQRQHSQPRHQRTKDIVVVKQAADPLLDEDIRRLQEIPTFLPIMRGTLGLPGARDPEILQGLDYRPWVRLSGRVQAHLAACATPLAGTQSLLTNQIKQVDAEVSRLYSQAVERQRANARHAERLSRVRELSHQLSRCNSILMQSLADITELNQLLPVHRRLEPFVWSVPGAS